MSGSETASRAQCMLCGRPTFDPSKKDRPWSRGVAGGHAVLVCPQCQKEHPEWATGLDRCERCRSTRLSLMLGEVICRQCGLTAGTLETGDDVR